MHFLVLLTYIGFLSAVQAITWPWDDSSSSSSSSSASATSSSSSSSSDSSLLESLLDDIKALPSDVSLLSNAIESRLSSIGHEETDSPYTPMNGTCPSETLVRNASKLNLNEKDYVLQRHAITNEYLKDFLVDVASMNDFDPEEFIDKYQHVHNITIGLTFSGGGYRAMLNGAGALLSMDDRYDNSNSEGLGGLLQSSTYLVGLSGGSWLVGSVSLNDWASVNDILDGTTGIWDLENPIFNPSGINLYATAKYYLDIEQEVGDKQDAGYPTSMTDVWGRGLAYQFFADGLGGVNITWSDLRNMSNFKNYTMPYPIIVADGRAPDTTVIDLNSTVFEFSAYELGSWDPSLSSFVDVKYTGTYLEDGKSNGSCVTGFDNAGFVLGTSSSVFNQIVSTVNTSDISVVLKDIMTNILEDLSYAEEDVAAYEPNPFYKSSYGTAENIINNETLFLVDGGEDLQNIPFGPLMQPLRGVDVVFAFDNSADTSENWPNGTSMVATYQRQFSKQGKGVPFPYVPDVSEFVDDELNQGPVFFGCDAKNLSKLVEYHDVDGLNETDIPLVVYMPNHYLSGELNTSTYKLSYKREEMLDIVQNGFEVASQKNYTKDKNWATCVGCAIVRRQFERQGLEQLDECSKCFDTYCWGGSGKDAAASSSEESSSGTATVTSTASGSGSSKSSSKKSDAGSVRNHFSSMVMAVFMGMLLI